MNPEMNNKCVGKAVRKKELIGEADRPIYIKRGDRI